MKESSALRHLSRPRVRMLSVLLLGGLLAMTVGTRSGQCAAVHNKYVELSVDMQTAVLVC